MGEMFPRSKEDIQKVKDLEKILKKVTPRGFDPKANPYDKGARGVFVDITLSADNPEDAKRTGSAVRTLTRELERLGYATIAGGKGLKLTVALEEKYLESVIKIMDGDDVRSAIEAERIVQTIAYPGPAGMELELQVDVNVSNPSGSKKMQRGDRITVDPSSTFNPVKGDIIDVDTAKIVFTDGAASVVLEVDADA